MGPASATAVPRGVRARFAHFVCRDEQELAWQMDMNRRIGASNRRAAGLYTLVLFGCAPWFHPAALGLVAVGGAIFGVSEAVTRRVQRLEPIVLAWPLLQGAMAGAIALNGRAQKGDLIILLVPLMGACAGFPGRIVRFCAVYTIALMVVLSLAHDAGAVWGDPPLLAIPAGAVVSLTLLASTARGSSREHQAAAVVDQLTGMLNRTALANRAAELGHQTSLNGQPVGMLVVDVDRFKVVNDEHGHAAGDAVLVDVAYRLRKELRGTDAAYRLGGEEFVLLLPGADPDALVEAGERLRRAVAAAPSDGVRVTVSVGAAATAPDTAFAFDEVFAEADAALYAAKEAGRDRVVCAGSVATGSAVGAEPLPAAPLPA